MLPLLLLLGLLSEAGQVPTADEAGVAGRAVERSGQTPAPPGFTIPALGRVLGPSRLGGAVGSGISGFVPWRPPATRTAPAAAVDCPILIMAAPHVDADMARPIGPTPDRIVRDDLSPCLK